MADHPLRPGGRIAFGRRKRGALLNVAPKQYKRAGGRLVVTQYNASFSTERRRGCRGIGDAAQRSLPPFMRAAGMVQVLPSRSGTPF
jgi:hypothetical protein